MLRRALVDIVNFLLWRFNAQLQLAAFRSVQYNVLHELFYRYYHHGFFFLQIGANDGRRADPLRKLVMRHKLTGLAVEPLPDIFMELKKIIADIRRSNWRMLQSIGPSWRLRYTGYGRTLTCPIGRTAWRR